MTYFHPLYSLLSSSGMSIAGFGTLHRPAWQSPPGLDRPRAGQRHGACWSCRWVLWRASVHYRPSVRLYLSRRLALIIIANASPLIPIMERNIALNSLQSCVTVADLDWYVTSIPLLGPLHHIPRSKPVPEHLPRPDIVLAADCVYFEPAFPLLVATLAALVPLPHGSAPMAHAPPEVLFCYKKRRKADKRFFTMLKKQFTWSMVCKLLSFRNWLFFRFPPKMKPNSMK